MKQGTSQEGEVNEWQPIETAPNDLAYESDRRVDLWVMVEHNGCEFRVPDCFLMDDEWRSDHYHYPLRIPGWEPLFWMDRPDPPAGANLKKPEMQIRKMSDIIHIIRDSK